MLLGVVVPSWWPWVVDVPGWVGPALGGIVLGIIANELTPWPRKLLGFIARNLVALLVMGSKRYAGRSLRILREDLARVQSYRASPQLMYAVMLRHLFHGVMYAMYTLLMFVALMRMSYPSVRDEPLPAGATEFFIAMFTFTFFGCGRNLVTPIKDVTAILNYDKYEPDVVVRIQSLEGRLKPPAR
jgi:hypothetical protein